MEDKALYKSLMDKYVDLAQAGDMSLLEVFDIAKKLSKVGNVDLESKEEIDSQCYVNLMGIYKKLSFEGNVPLAMNVLDAASYLMREGDVSSDAAYAGAVI